MPSLRCQEFATSDDSGRGMAAASAPSPPFVRSLPLSHPATTSSALLAQQFHPAVVYCPVAAHCLLAHVCACDAQECLSGYSCLSGSLLAPRMPAAIAQ